MYKRVAPFCKNNVQYIVMTSMSSNTLLLQCNLAKKSVANAELALFTDFLLKSNHIDEHNCVRGMAEFEASFGARNKRSLLCNVRNSSTINSNNVDM